MIMNERESISTQFTASLKVM